MTNLYPHKAGSVITTSLINKNNNNTHTHTKTIKRVLFHLKNYIIVGILQLLFQAISILYFLNVFFSFRVRVY